MKKILLATTLLAATTGFAAAEVALSGDARMGIVSTAGANAVFDTRARVGFALSGETDSGLSFGASFRADNASDAAAGEAGSVTVSGAFGTIAMGDVDGAAKGAVGHVAGVGYTGLGDLNESTYIGGGTKESVLYTYSAGAVTVMASTDQTGGNDVYAVGAAYAGEGFGVSAGYENNGAGTTHAIVGATTTLGGVALKAVYGSASGVVDGTQYAVSATYTADALSATAFYTDDSELDGVKASGLGIGYAIGGGATIGAGYAKPANGDASYDVGVNFSF